MAFSRFVGKIGHLAYKLYLISKEFFGSSVFIKVILQESAKVGLAGRLAIVGKSLKFSFRPL